MTDRVGQQLGNYQLQRMIGTGGFAEVYLAEHKYLRTQAGIKVLHARLASNDQEFFLNEARTVAHLIHPHIIRVLEFGVEDATPFLVMDYAPNGTLRQLHPKGSCVPLATIVSYVKQIAEALDYAHSQQVIHRDIKPENMLVGAKNTILLSDFGIAQVAQSSRLQNARDIAGTIAYMAPEQISAYPRIASDQYSLGVVVYEWLTGELPFRGSFTEIAVKHNLVPPPSFYEKMSGMTRAVEEVVMTALAKEPQRRFTHVGAFAHALEQASQYIADSIAPTSQVPLAAPYTSVPVLAPPVQIQNPVTPYLFNDAATMISEPDIASERITPPQQKLTELAPPAFASERRNTTPAARKGLRKLLVLGLLLLIIVGSTGIFLTVFAHKSVANNPTTIMTKASPVVKAKNTPVPADPLNAQDTFQRPDQSLWGQASDGQSWIEEANNNPVFSITNKTGQLAQANGAFNALLGGKRNNEEIVFTGSINHFGQGVNIGSVIRWTDDGDWYKAFIDGRNLVLIKRVGGKSTTIGSVAFAAKDAVSYSLRFRVLGTTLFAKAWQSGQQEPDEWMLTGTDTTFASVQGFGGLRFSLRADNIVNVTMFRATKIHPVTA